MINLVNKICESDSGVSVREFIRVYVTITCQIMKYFII